MDEQNRNLILATALSFLVILVWTVFFAPIPEDPPLDPATNTATNAGSSAAPAPPASSGGAAAPGGLGDAQITSRDDMLATSDRIKITSDRLTGSISLTGGRIDDLSLIDYKETLDDGSPLVTLLSPAGSPNAYYALHGWSPTASTDAPVPGKDTEWRIVDGGDLAVGSPVTLEWDNGAGLVFRKQISLDENYLFTISQSVENTTAEAIRLAPYGIIARHGKPDTVGFYILHEGVVRASDGEIGEINYGDMVDFTQAEGQGLVERIDVAQNGWIGFTDKYWMTTLIPAAGTPFASVAKYTPAIDIYQTDMRLNVMEIAPGNSGIVETHLFAGAKEWETIRNYETNLGIAQFIDSIDWGWFFFLTKPMFWVLHTLNVMIGNMGWAIIGLTVIIKIILFPLSYKSYVSMAKMKNLQPEMEKIKEKAGDDRQKLQQEMMALYKKEKVNPAAGCLPILAQIPIFFSLYKVIFVTLEVRHAPFIGWIKDLSAPDPTSWMNLFGALPYEIPAFLGILSIGVWPILMGISMWLQQKLNPAPTDPTQAMVFAWMPWIFMFMLGTFASGLVIYWVANNMLTFAQQYIIMRSQGMTPDVFGNITSGLKRKPAGEEAPPANDKTPATKDKKPPAKAKAKDKK